MKYVTDGSEKSQAAAAEHLREELETRRLAAKEVARERRLELAAARRRDGRVTSNSTARRKAARRRAIHREANRLHEVYGVPKAATRCRLRDEDLIAAQRGNVRRRFESERFDRLTRLPTHRRSMHPVVLQRLCEMSSENKVLAAKECFLRTMKTYNQPMTFDIHMEASPVVAAHLTRDDAPKRGRHHRRNYIAWKARVLQSLSTYRRAYRRLVKSTPQQLVQHTELELVIMLVRDTNMWHMAAMLNTPQRLLDLRALAATHERARVQRMRPDWQEDEPEEFPPDAPAAATIPGYKDMHPAVLHRMIRTSQQRLSDIAQRDARTLLIANGLLPPIDYTNPVAVAAWVGGGVVEKLAALCSAYPREAPALTPALVVELYRLEILRFILPKVVTTHMARWLDLPLATHAPVS